MRKASLLVPGQRYGYQWKSEDKVKVEVKVNIYYFQGGVSGSDFLNSFNNSSS
jgi:hypothetical protein